MAFSGFFNQRQVRVAVRRLQAISPQDVTLLQSEELIVGAGDKRADTCEGHVYVLKASVPVGGWVGHYRYADKTFYNSADVSHYFRCYGHLFD